MMKKIIFVILMVVIVSIVPGNYADANGTYKATVTSSRILLNDREIQCAGFNIGGNNYFRLRDLAARFSGTTGQFNVSWDGAMNQIAILTGRAYEPLATEETRTYRWDKIYETTRTTSQVLVDGVLQPVTAYNIDGSNYFKLRDLGGVIPFDVYWDEETETIRLYTVVDDNADGTTDADAGTIENGEESGYTAEDPGQAQTAASESVETNYSAHNNEAVADPTRWSEAETSYMMDNGDGTFGVFEALQGLTYEQYDSRNNLIGYKQIAEELPIFGAFYSGEQYNYIAFGQDNPYQIDDLEVVRIVRYDKKFNRIDSASIAGGECFTVTPFAHACGRMAEVGDTLVFHTSRLGYKTQDGHNHQSQLTIFLNTKTMTVANEMGPYQKNHVSHSFDQYVEFDGNDAVLVDHGDAYPRAVVLHRGDGAAYESVNLFDIPGDIGANATGISIGGFEISSQKYIVVMNSVDHAQVTRYTSYALEGLDEEHRDIVLCTVPKDNLTAGAVSRILLAKYSDTDKFTSVPRMVKVSDKRLMVLWQEFDRYYRRGDLKYVWLDENGNRLGQVQTLEGFVLAEETPIVSGNRIIWSVNAGGVRKIYAIPVI